MPFFSKKSSKNQGFLWQNQDKCEYSCKQLDSQPLLQVHLACIISWFYVTNDFFAKSSKNRYIFKNHQKTSKNRYLHHCLSEIPSSLHYSAKSKLKKNSKVHNIINKFFSYDNIYAFWLRLHLGFLFFSSDFGVVGWCRRHGRRVLEGDVFRWPHFGQIDH